MVENEAIQAILKKIYNKWSMELAQASELSETVILSSDSSKKRTISPSLLQEEALSETVIIAPEDNKDFSSSTPGKKPISPGAQEHAGSLKEIGESESAEKKNKHPDNEDFLSETIILTPRETQHKDKNGTE